jgi:peptide/nickel transport system permease protein
LTERTASALPTVGAAVPAPKSPLSAPRRPLATMLAASWELVLGGAVLILVVASALFAAWLTPCDPRAIAVEVRLASPSAAHLFGTDGLGRDLLARVLYGGRVSLGIGFSAALLSALIGASVGIVSPTSRTIDAVVMRILDGVMSIPTILLAIALVAVAGATVQNVVIAVTVVEAPRIARIIRSEVLSLRERPFIDAAIASGSSTPKIMLRHLLPGVIPQLIVQTTFVWGAAMMIEAGLSFIGAGTPPSTPSWGNIMADGRALWQVRPNLIFVPAAFLSCTLFAVNLLGEGLRKALNPRAMRGR